MHVPSAAATAAASRKNGEDVCVHLAADKMPIITERQDSPSMPFAPLLTTAKNPLGSEPRTIAQKP